MRRYSTRTSLTALTELNITPLLDLAFVLLIIFMITTPLIENSLDLVVPASSTAKTEVNPSDVQVVSLDRNDIAKLNEEVVPFDQLEGRLLDLKARNPQIAVAVRAHRELPIQKFIAVMDVLQRIGIAKVGVMTRPEEQNAR